MAGHKDLEESEFYMWRSIFAFAFVDNNLSLEEQQLLQSYINSVNFSEKQLGVIRQDFKDPPKVVDMHKKITRSKDKERFCSLARALVWCEGDMDRQEAEILKRVSCMKEDKTCNANFKEPFEKTRGDSHLFYQNYARAGLVGLLKTPSHQVEIRA